MDTTVSKDILNNKPLNTEELLRLVHVCVCSLLGGVQTLVDFGSDPVMPMIADASDNHRSRSGYAVYQQATVIQLPSKLFVSAVGLVGGHYPADPYSADICFIKAVYPPNIEQPDLASIARTALSNNTWYLHSMLVALREGTFQARSELAFKLTQNLVGRGIVNNTRLTSQFDITLLNMEVDKSYIASSSPASIVSPLTYYSSFTNVLADNIVSVLRQ